MNVRHPMGLKDFLFSNDKMQELEKKYVVSLAESYIKTSSSSIQFPKISFIKISICQDAKYLIYLHVRQVSHSFCNLQCIRYHFFN